jgi:hypothetical protein
VPASDSRVVAPFFLTSPRETHCDEARASALGALTVRERCDTKTNMV